VNDFNVLAPWERLDSLNGASYYADPIPTCEKAGDQPAANITGGTEDKNSRHFSGFSRLRAQLPLCAAGACKELVFGFGVRESGVGVVRRFGVNV
jgi:hypothetical protein